MRSISYPLGGSFCHVAFCRFFSGFTPSKADPNFVYKYIEKGDGPTAVNFQSVTMQYTGYLLDGKQFDTSYGKDPFKFRIGKGKVISGWEGLALGMKAGTKLIAKIPAKYAYGRTRVFGLQVQLKAGCTRAG